MKRLGSVISTSPRYDAFMSYSHADRRAANRIHTYLEHYKLPGGRRLRVYLDRTDIRSGDLSAEIRDALDAAGALVVCCSAAAAKSEWVAREIDVFLAGTPRPVGIVLVADDPPSSVPGALRDRELRYADVRRAWRLGMFRPAGRTELVRLIAMIAGLELRALIPWDRRHRLRRLAATVASVVLLTIGGLSVPVPTWRELPPPPSVAKMRYSIDAAEAHGADLVLVMRMPSTSSRGYVEVWRGPTGALGTGKWVERNFNPRSRLLPIKFADSDLTRSALPALGISNRDGLWIGEPVPDHFVAVRPHLPEDYTPVAGEALIGFSDVWVASPGVPPRHARVDNLYADAVLPPGGARLFDVSAGIAVAWGSAGIWIGTRISPSFSTGGGLWHSDDGGETFRAIKAFRNVHSVLADEPAPGRVLVAEVARLAPPNTQVPIPDVRRSRIAIGPAEGVWQEFDGPPHGDSDVLELVGRPENGHLVIRVGQSLYEHTRAPLGSWFRSRR